MLSALGSPSIRGQVPSQFVISGTSSCYQAQELRAQTYHDGTDRCDCR